MNLTDEEMRIAIAEACGWKPYKPITHDGWPLLMTPPKKPNKEGWLEPIPDYLNDLNAIHEAIMSLPINKRDQFDVELAVVVHGDFIRHQVRYQRFETTNATARQRCLAYLKTKGIIP